MIVEYACVSKCGYYPDEPTHTVQDSFTLCESKFVRNGVSSSGLYMAVYDGHGEYGGECSRFCRDFVRSDGRR